MCTLHSKLAADVIDTLWSLQQTMSSMRTWSWWPVTNHTADMVTLSKCTKRSRVSLFEISDGEHTYCADVLDVQAKAPLEGSHFTLRALITHQEHLLHETTQRTQWWTLMDLQKSASIAVKQTAYSGPTASMRLLMSCPLVAVSEGVTWV